MERKRRQKVYEERTQAAQQTELSTALPEVESSGDSSELESTDSSEVGKPEVTPAKRKRVMSSRVCAVLDRTNTSVRKASMVVASVLNEAGTSTSRTVLSKSTVLKLKVALFRRNAWYIGTAS